MAIALAFAISTPAYSELNRGKAIFNDSCIHCHGAEGKGNTVQDKFWNVRIPRLNEASIQRMSDADLSNVILNGKRKMPPAMMGQPDAPHRTKVTKEQVPDLIDYIRSLKSSLKKK
jgi:mono/diheme cytochrome c family protein